MLHKQENILVEVEVFYQQKSIIIFILKYITLSLGYKTFEIFSATFLAKTALI